VLVIDLAGVRFLNSMGIAALVFAHMRATAGTVVRIVADGPATTGVLKLMGVDGSMSLFPTCSGSDRWVVSRNRTYVASVGGMGDACTPGGCEDRMACGRSRSLSIRDNA
jgi:hypothetical protein